MSRHTSKPLEKNCENIKIAKSQNAQKRIKILKIHDVKKLYWYSDFNSLFVFHP